MGFESFIQLTINGLIAGSKYALVASGFALIYATNKFMHFAHGVSVVIAGYIFYTFFILASLPVVPSVLFTLVASVVFGLGTYRFIYLPLQNKKASNVVLLIVSISTLVLFENLIQIIYGSDLKIIGVFKADSISVFGGFITPFQISLIIITLILFVSLFFIMKY